MCTLYADLAGVSHAGQCQPDNVHVLEGLACRKRIAPASSLAAPASRLRRLQLRQAFERMLWSQNS